MVTLVAVLALVSVPLAPGRSSAADLPVSAVPDLRAGPAAGVASAAGTGDTPVETAEVDLEGIDAASESELLSIDAGSSETVTATADPETEPGLEVENPLGLLPDDVSPEIITEKMSAAPFSVMGVTWDLDAALTGVVVQYRTFRDGAWTDWSWVGPAEEYVEVTESSQPSRGATDAVVVPDSTGVQLVVSASTGTPSGVKVVLIDPGNGPDGTGASQSSGEPSDTGAVAPDPTPAVPGGAVTTDSEDRGLTVSPSPGVAPGPETLSGASDAPTEDPGTPSEDGTGDPVPTVPEPGTADLGTPGPSTASGRAASGGGGGATSALVLPAASVARPAMVSRAQWGAPAPVCQVDYGQELRAAAIHHTASTNSYTAAQVPGILRGFAEYHMRPEAAGGRGWCDLGYNFLVDKFGTVYEGRGGGADLPVVGVHTGGFNSRIVGVAAIGNYQEVVPSAQLNESLSQIIAWKLAQHRVTANASVTLVSGGGATKHPLGTPVTFSTIFGHRDAQYTSCPGQFLYAAFGDIRNRVASLANPVVAESPEGSWDLIRGGGDSVRVAGWARDPSAVSSAVQVQVVVDGTVRSTISASNTRFDVGAHGYDSSVTVSPGAHVVCLRYVNIGGGNDIVMGCQTATATASSPVGVIDDISATASSISIRGWARDPDSTAPIAVHLYIDGTIVQAVTANGARPDVERSAPGVAGPAHGFTATLPAGSGRHEVCVYGINVGAGANAGIGCRDVTVENHRPIGWLDTVSALNPDGVRVQGWALDPDTNAPIAVHVYVDGEAPHGLRADGARPDVGRRYGLGDAHGFTVDLAVAPGRHEICVYGIDSQGGDNSRIGCWGVTVVNTAPLGALDEVIGGSGVIRARGWAFDPDTEASIYVHVYVDGHVVLAPRAATSRPDVGRAYGRGSTSGFDATVSASPGRHEVCVFAIDSTKGSNPPLGCRSVDVT